MTIEVTHLKSVDREFMPSTLDEIAAEFREASEALRQAIQQRAEGERELKRIEHEAQRRLDRARYNLHRAVLGLTPEEMQDAVLNGTVFGL